MKKILLIDDERDIRYVMRETLIELGHSVVEGVGGADGLDKFATEKPDLILLDLAMPGVSGIEVLEEIRRSGNSSYPPVILLSGSTDDYELQRATSLGIQGRIKKPWEFDDVTECVDSALSATAETR